MAHMSKKLIVILCVVLIILVGVLWGKKASRYDNVILEKISAELASDETLENTEVSVRTGVVFLKGSVRLLEDQRRAVKKASGVEHVRRVESKIVLNTRRVPDLRLLLQLKQVMREQQLREIKIKVKKGTVMVRGPVSGEAERERVLAQVSSTEGVRAIDDRLIVVESDKLPVHGMHDGLKSIMCSKFLVDVVEMVAECLQGYPKILGDFRRVLSVGEPAKNALFLFRE